MGKYFHGRRVHIIVYSLAFSLFVEILSLIDSTGIFNCYNKAEDSNLCLYTDDLLISKDKPFEKFNLFRLLFVVRITVTFYIDYLVVILGMFDFAKMEVLKNNHRLGATTYFTMLSGQQLFQALFYEPQYKDFQD